MNHPWQVSLLARKGSVVLESFVNPRRIYFDGDESGPLQKKRKEQRSQIHLLCQRQQRHPTPNPQPSENQPQEKKNGRHLICRAYSVHHNHSLPHDFTRGAGGSPKSRHHLQRHSGALQLGRRQRSPVAANCLAYIQRIPAWPFPAGAEIGTGKRKKRGRSPNPACLAVASSFNLRQSWQIKENRDSNSRKDYLLRRGKLGFQLCNVASNVSSPHVYVQLCMHTLGGTPLGGMNTPGAWHDFLCHDAGTAMPQSSKPRSTSSTAGEEKQKTTGQIHLIDP